MHQLSEVGLSRQKSMVRKDGKRREKAEKNPIPDHLLTSVLPLQKAYYNILQSINALQSENPPSNKFF